ncbi:hypothetical protein BC332_31851 [Capsicum chinense]|nr:hypothetical protein BC332_31851 [Capsicum chinense]
MEKMDSINLSKTIKAKVEEAMIFDEKNDNEKGNFIENEKSKVEGEGDSNKKGNCIENRKSEVEAEAEETDIISDEKGNCFLENGKSNDVSNSINIEKSNLNSDIHAEKNGNVLLGIIKPHTLLPQPEPPAGASFLRSKSMPESNNFDMPDIGKFFREKSNSLSSAIKSLFEEEEKTVQHVTEFNLSGTKVIVVEKKKKQLFGRVSFFSRSNCRDCTAVRSFLRKENLNYVEINIDVYPERENELISRTGGSDVPVIFLNEKVIGGLVALNSLRNSGLLERKLEEMLAGKCPDDAPAPPVYGFDYDDANRNDEELIEIVKILRQKLPIQDRIMRMKIVKNCFAGGELVEILIHHLDCGRKKAVEIGKNLSRRHFIHHVFGENEFEDGKHFYRFLEHEPFIPKCYNFRGSTNDNEPKDAAVLGQRLGKIMSAVLESYASDDRHHLDYVGISNSEEFRRYTNLVQDLHRVNILTLSAGEKLAFFLNLYNAMAIHAVIRVGHPGGMIDRRAFFSEFQYIVGGYSYSLSGIKDGILGSNRRAPFALMKPFPSGDRRLEIALQKVNPLIHFGLCNATRSSPAVRFFTPKSVESELRHAAREYFQRDDAMQVDLAKRTVYLSRMIKWYSGDFGQEKELLKWITGYLDATKAGLLTHLMGDGGPVNVVYSSFDWSLNA